jgi:hypothetical protein
MNTLITVRPNSPRLTGMLAAASLLLSGTIAQAATADGGLYLNFFGGFSGLSSGDLIQSGATSKGDYDGGTIVGMALGKQLNQDWALEAEWFYRSNEISSVTGGPFNGVNNGDFASTNLMFNAIYYFHATDKVKLYCGRGRRRDVRHPEGSAGQSADRPTLQKDRHAHAGSFRTDGGCDGSRIPA